MNFWQALTEKSWLATPGGTASMAAERATDFATKRVALHLFLAIATVFFSLFVVTFLSHSQYPDFQALSGEPWKPFADTSRLWLNTGLLFLSSLAMHGALLGARADKPTLALIALVVAVLFALQFLLAQLSLWQHLDTMGYGVRSNPASSYFYLLTALHGVHLLGGVLVLGRTLMGFWNGIAPEKITGSIKLCTTYWHFLFVVWLALFALLTASPETYQTLAALCGF